jgi:tRNA (guanine37-N1)-methyltransferase
LADEELSIGDYVLTNGALPAMVIIDSVTRLLPGALGDDQSSVEESFSHGLVEYPHWTRPAEFRGLEGARVLMSGIMRKSPAGVKIRNPSTDCGTRPDLWDKAAMGSIRDFRNGWTGRNNGIESGRI